MLILFVPIELISNVVASCKATSAYTCMLSIGVVCLLPFLVAIIFLSSTISAFQVTYPPLDTTRSILSLARDSSLVPPYNVDGEEENSNEGKLSLKSSESDEEIKTVHFCFLVHGFQGLSGDLSYFEAVLKHRAFVERNHEELIQKNGRFDTDGDFVIVPAVTHKKTGALKTQDMVVHNVVCNEGKTNDGVINGGDRLLEEMKEVIDSNMKRRYPDLDDGGDKIEKDESKVYDITISMIGNSMGGLYARYAIAKLIERHCVAETTPTNSDGGSESKEKGSTSWILDGKYRLRLDIFCTTATPHLGISQHTWIRIPRIAEMGVAATMGQTGNDLFRLNNLLYTMSTDLTFLVPLACFRKRIAYANCYGTDFPVPVGTAAFLSEKSSYPHKFVNEFKVEDECDLVIATLATSAKEEDDDGEEPLDELHQMSISLDRLGWKKVFIDLQKEMLSFRIPDFACEMDRKSDSESSDDLDLRDLKKTKETVTSKDIVNAVNRNSSDNNRFVLRAPFGHNMIVAFSRDRLSSFLNKGGRPLVDALANDFVQDIFASGGCDEE